MGFRTCFPTQRNQGLEGIVERREGRIDRIGLEINMALLDLRTKYSKAFKLSVILFVARL